MSDINTKFEREIALSIKRGASPSQALSTAGLAVCRAPLIWIAYWTATARHQQSVERHKQSSTTAHFLRSLVTAFFWREMVIGLSRLMNLLRRFPRWRDTI